ncbi:hypothetical protein [Parafilimonas sp.]|uniref:hypothetical protein n=1 Tax=Parafilimonas sp. TaxID=1969739 RepID=UPI003F812B17
MLSPDKLFGNLFNEEAITPVRLANFAQDALNKLTAAANPDFSFIISKLTTPLVVVHQIAQTLLISRDFSCRRNDVRRGLFLQSSLIR